MGLAPQGGIVFIVGIGAIALLLVGLALVLAVVEIVKCLMTGC